MFIERFEHVRSPEQSTFDQVENRIDESTDTWLRLGLSTWRELFGLARNPNTLAIHFFRHVLLSSDVLRPRAKFG